MVGEVDAQDPEKTSRSKGQLRSKGSLSLVDLENCWEQCFVEKKGLTQMTLKVVGAEDPVIGEVITSCNRKIGGINEQRTVGINSFRKGTNLLKSKSIKANLLISQSRSSLADGFSMNIPRGQLQGLQAVPMGQLSIGDLACITLVVGESLIGPGLGQELLDVRDCLASDPCKAGGMKVKGGSLLQLVIVEIVLTECGVRLWVEIANAGTSNSAVIDPNELTSPIAVNLLRRPLAKECLNQMECLLCDAVFEAKLSALVGCEPCGLARAG